MTRLYFEITPYFFRFVRHKNLSKFQKAHELPKSSILLKYSILLNFESNIFQSAKLLPLKYSNLKGVGV